MGSPAAAFKTAQESALRASIALKAAMALAEARIYTEAPTNAVLPYNVIGDDQILLQGSPGCADEAELISTIRLWSRVKPLDGGQQARAMGAAIIDTLNLELTIPGWDVDDWEVLSESYSTDPDQSTRGIVVLRYLLTQQAA